MWSKTMRSTLVVLTALWVMGISACSRDSFPSEFDEKPTQRFAPAENEYFGPPEPALKQLLLAENKNGVKNEFCVIGYAYTDNIVNVWAHWMNEQRLLLWRGNSDEELREQGLVMADRDLALDEDTVETKDDIKGSTYLVTRAWWRAVAQDCATHGQRYTIEPFSADSAAETPADNPRLVAMYAEDQSDRIDWRNKKITSKRLLERDEQRRAEVLALLADGQVRTGHDFFCAAVVFHHGQTVDHYRTAVSLAWVGMTLDPANKDHLYLVASSWDRFMLKQNRPQWYGTKCVYEAGRPTALHPVDETAVTDEDRARFDLKPLAVMRSQLEAPIRLSGKSARC
jgi:hypothetical protein